MDGGRRDRGTGWGSMNGHGSGTSKGLLEAGSSSASREGVQLGEEPDYTAYRYRRPEEPPLIRATTSASHSSSSKAANRAAPFTLNRAMLDGDDQDYGQRRRSDHQRRRTDHRSSYGRDRDRDKRRGGGDRDSEDEEDEDDDRDRHEGSSRRRGYRSYNGYRDHGMNGSRSGPNGSSSRAEDNGTDMWEDGPPRRLTTPLPFTASAADGDDRARFARPDGLLNRVSSGHHRTYSNQTFSSFLPLHHSTLWVRELDQGMGPEELRAYFEELVPIANVKIPLPKQGIPPYGFIKCVHLSDAERLLELQESDPADHFYMSGRKIMLRPGKNDLDDPEAASRPQRPPSSTNGRPSLRSERSDRSEGARKIFVAGLDLRNGREQNAAVDEVAGIFSRYGRLEHVSVPPRALEDGADPFAFVTFVNHADAAEALRDLRAEGLKVRWYVTDNDGTRAPSPPGRGRFNNAPVDNGYPERRDRKRTYSGHDGDHALKRSRMDDRPRKDDTTKTDEPTAGVFVRGPFRSANSRSVRDLEKDLDDLFSPFGALVFTSVPNKSLVAAQARGDNALFGFVRFEQIDDAQAALQSMDGQRMEVGGRLFVRYDENARQDAENAAAAAASQALDYDLPPVEYQVDVMPAEATENGLPAMEAIIEQSATASPALHPTELAFEEAPSRQTSRQPSPLSSASPEAPLLEPSCSATSIDAPQPSPPPHRSPTPVVEVEAVVVSTEAPLKIMEAQPVVVPEPVPAQAEPEPEVEPEPEPEVEVEPAEAEDEDMGDTAVKRVHLPLNCLKSHKDHLKHRKTFRFQTIRQLAASGTTVLDAEYDGEDLVLTIVAESTSRQSSAPAPPEQVLADQPTVTFTPEPQPADEKEALDVEPNGDQVKLPGFIFQQPEYAFIDDPAGQLRASLSAFLAVYFRFWEESRAELCTLYDTAAVFSNVLSKQGCRPQGVTKQNSWPSILSTISRLPALSHDDGMDDWVVDAWLYPGPDGDRAFCVVHGSFTEFPKKTQRAFDRTFVLRPADPRSIAYVRHGVRWIILSDTLMIRKFNVKAGSLVRAMRPMETSEVFAGEPGRRVQSPPSIHSHSIGSEPPESSRITVSTQSSRDVAIAVPAVPLAAEAPPAGAGPDMALLAGQLAALQAEVEKLKAAQTRVQASGSSSGESSSPTPPSVRRDSRRSEDTPPGLQVTTSGNYSHKSLGAKKRLLLRADGPGAYFALSFRGDVVAFHDGATDAKDKVQLVQSAPSTTHTVDGAVFSEAHSSLVVGYFGDKDSPPSCQVSISKAERGPKGAVAPSREMLTTRPHDRGVVSICLLPETAQRDSLTFATAGHDRKIVVWKTFGDYTETQGLRTAHTNTIQSLELDPVHNWVLSVGRDKRFMAHDLQTQEAAFNVKEIGLLSQVILNPDQPHTATLVASDAPNGHFRIYDLRRPTRPTQTFGMPMAPGKPDAANLSVYRKGASRSNTFAFAGIDTDGTERGVRIWDLRNLKTSVLDIGKSVALQPWFEDSSRITVLGREDITFASLSV